MLSIIILHAYGTVGEYYLQFRFFTGEHQCQINLSQALESVHQAMGVLDFKIFTKGYKKDIFN